MSDPSLAGTTDPGAEERPADPATPRRGPGARAAWITCAVLAVLLVAAVATAVVLGRRADDQDRQARARSEVTAVATQFALRMDAVNGADFERYIKNVNQLLTTKAKTKNSQQIQVMKQTYEAAKVKGQGKVLLTAIGDSDADSATVLVVHDSTVDTSQGKIAHHYRWTVDLVKVGKKWLVDDFNPVN